MIPLDANDFKEFFGLAETLARNVSEGVYDVGDSQLSTLTASIAKSESRCLLDATIQFSQGLLDAIAKTPMLPKSRTMIATESYAWVQPYITFMESRGNAFTFESLRGRQAEVAMELLAACFLVFYFLGNPFTQTWERVRRFADEQGGFPSGACMTKVLGDTYRGARLFNADREPLRRESVWALSSNPSLLVRQLLGRTEVDKLTPASVHTLARCYALIQLRLLVAEGHPVRYLVPLSAWKKAWIMANQQQPVFDSARCIAQARSCLKQVFQSAQANLHQVYVLKASQLELGLPYCVLGPKSGAYMLDATVGDAKFGGNRISDRLLYAYRAEMAQAPLADAFQLVGARQEHWDDVQSALQS